MKKTLLIVAAGIVTLLISLHLILRYSGVSHLFSHQTSTSGSVGKHIDDGGHIFCKERCFCGVA
jgi:hypothetical protein